MILYIRTLAPGLLYSDSGELQTLVNSLGMAHPTGYAVYILLGRLFTLIPLGSLAWQVNLFSAVLGAMTVSFVYLIIRLLSGWRMAAVVGSTILAINPLFWYFSVIAELYVPAAAFISGAILCLLLWQQTGKLPWLAAAGMLVGLSPGIHGLAALIAPVVLLYIILMSITPHRTPKSFKSRTLLAALGGLSLGVLLTLGAYLFIDAQNPSAGYYNATVLTSLDYLGITASDFDSPFERLKLIFLAGQFQPKMFDKSILSTHSISYLKWMLNGFSWFSMTLMGLGAIGLFVRRWQEGLLLLLCWGIEMIFIIFYNIFDIASFFVPTYVFLAVWTGEGVRELMEFLNRSLHELRMQKWYIPAAALLAISILSLTTYSGYGRMIEAWQARAVIFMQSEPFVKSSYEIDNPNSAYTKAKAIVDSLEEDAIVFVGWRELFPCYYVALEEGRTALDFHQIFLQKGSAELSHAALNYIETNLGVRPIYFLDSPNVSRMNLFELEKIKRGEVTLQQVISLQN